MLIFSDMEKKEFSCQIRLPLVGDPVLSAFHGMETPGMAPVLREQEETHWIISHNLEENSRRGDICKGCFPEHRCIGLVFFYEYTLKHFCFQSLVGDVCVKGVLL